MTGFIELRNKQLTVWISPVGAAVARVWHPEHPTSLVLGLAKTEDYAENPQAIGVIVGPIAGRIANATAPLEQTSVTLDANTPPDCLHSGRAGIQHKTWTVAEHEDTHVLLTLTLPDGDGGLPGTRNVAARYSLDGDTLTLDITMLSDKTTLFNAASHAYWCLDGRGGLSDHLLHLRSAKMAETSDALIPTGRVIDCAGGDFDFTSPRSPVSGAALDGCFCLADEPDVPMRNVLALRSSQTDLSLVVATNQPGVVLYTGAGLPELAAVENCPDIKPFAGLAIEAQGWPDAPNHASFPSIVRNKQTRTRQITSWTIARHSSATTGW